MQEFLSYAVKVEEDAAIHFDELSTAMEGVGNTAVAKLFAQLAAFSRLHLAEAQKRAGKVDAHLEIPPDYVWPDHVTPERTSLWAGDPALSRLDALRAALQGEKKGFEFYYAVAGTATDADIIASAKEFVHEEAEHVKVLEAWITREEWDSSTRLPDATAGRCKAARLAASIRNAVAPLDCHHGGGQECDEFLASAIDGEHLRLSERERPARLHHPATRKD